jgi:hypothetical protein
VTAVIRPLHSKPPVDPWDRHKSLSAHRALDTLKVDPPHLRPPFRTVFRRCSMHNVTSSLCDPHRYTAKLDEHVRPERPKFNLYATASVDKSETRE